MPALKDLLFILLALMMSGMETTVPPSWLLPAARMAASSCCCGNTIEKQCACQSSCCGVPQPAGSIHDVSISGACGDSSTSPGITFTAFKYVLFNPFAAIRFPRRGTYRGDIGALPVFNLPNRIEKPPITQTWNR